MTLQNPLTKERIILIQRQIPVLCSLLYRHSAREFRCGVDKLVGRERRATLLTLVTVCTLALTAWSGTDNIAVGEERLSLLVVELFRGLLDKLTLIVEFSKKVRSRHAVRR